jgi:hypothetical protein
VARRPIETLEWHEAIQIVRPHVVKISTPDGTGTGFYVSRFSVQPFVLIATAAHVIDHAHYWEQPIRVEQAITGKSVLLRHDNRAIFLNEDLDTAAIMLDPSDLELPPAPLPLVEEGKYIRTGIELGWLGFPSISRNNLCFFSGRISIYLDGRDSYLIDGVAINGVSGGPAFHISVDEVQVVGVVSAYIANRSTGETLPGVSIVRDVTHFQNLIRTFKSIDEARRAQSVLDEPPPPSFETSPQS